MPQKGGKTKRVIAFVEDCVTLEAPRAKQEDLRTEV